MARRVPGRILRDFSYAVWERMLQEERQIWRDRHYLRRGALMRCARRDPNY